MAAEALIIPDSKIHGANMGPIWGQQDPGGPHVGPMNIAIWEVPHRAFVGIEIACYNSPKIQIMFIWWAIISHQSYVFIEMAMHDIRW